MKIFGKHKGLVILVLLLVLSLALFLLVLYRKNNPFSIEREHTANSPQKVTESEESYEDISQFFEGGVTKEKEDINFNKPAPIGKKTECILNGESMLEGTVASDTVCVNQP